MDHTLYASAFMGDIKLIKDIIEQLNVVATPNNIILHVHLAFCRPTASTKFVEQVLEMCPLLLTQVNDHGDTPLHVAANIGHVNAAKVLIKYAKAQQTDLESSVTIVKQMLRMTNNDGNTALHEAARNHNLVELVKLLMSEDDDFSYDSVNNNGETALYIAVSRGSLDTVIEMLETCTSAAYKHKGPCEMTILHAAVRRNHPDVTRKILEKKYSQTNEASGNQWSLTKEMDKNGWTPLHYAAYYGHHLIVKLLVEFDASAACIADRCRKMTPLHLAAGQGHYDISDTIINSCPTCIEQVDDRGWNFVHFAICNLTTSYGVKGYHWPIYLLNAKDFRGNTPLLVLASISQDSFDLIKKQMRKELTESAMHTIQIGEEQFNQLKKEVSKLSKVSSEPYTRGVVHLSNEDFVQRWSILGKEIEMYLVVNTLIATVTFTAGLTLPGGYIQEDPKKGTAVLIKNSVFQAFVISNAIALLFSVLAVSFHVIWQVSKSRKHIFIIFHAHHFTIYALAAMVIAFVTGTYAILRPSLGLAISTVVVGSSFFFIHAFFTYRRIKIGSDNDIFINLYILLSNVKHWLLSMWTNIRFLWKLFKEEVCTMK